MAAVTAAQSGKKVLLLEKNGVLARKLGITGKGRCNITNDCAPDQMMDNIPTNPTFLFSALNVFSSRDVIAFFEDLGVATKTERGGRVFPLSDKAKDVCDAMTRYVKNSGATIRTGAQVEKILLNLQAVEGVVLTNSEIIRAKSVIVATGGASYPKTGSSGDGYRFASDSGHTIVPLVPSLVPMVAKERWVRDLAGLSLKNVNIKITDMKNQDNLLFQDFGEMLFTHFGVSGPIILSASSHIRDFSKQYMLYIDLKPALTFDALDKRLQRDFSMFSRKNFSNSLDNLLPKKMIDIITKLSGIAPECKVHQITREQRHSLVSLLKNLPITIVGTRPLEEAIITSGGVAAPEINPSTMQSRIVKGLFFAGEVIDVDAYTGGFNLQIAFSTGFLAGKKA